MRVDEYILKGGANLRLFYNSRRRSQDIGFDYSGSAFWRVEERVDEVLAARAFLDLLRVRGIELLDLSKSKQTATTCRWKFSVKRAEARLNSKIEFSARRSDPDIAFEPARTDIAPEAGLRAVRVNHYLPTAAIRQKIHALGGRKQTEPRDVFDLDLLVSQHPSAVRAGDVPSSLARRAASAAFEIPFEAYQELVVDFLEDEFVDIYNRAEVWEEMVTRVAGYLETLQ
jgi:hypothetical protein